MTTQPTPTKRGQDLLARMGQIPIIVQGKLSERHGGGKVTGYKLQRWRQGRNLTRHISAEMVDVVRQGTEGYREFQALVRHYAEIREEEALQGSPTSKKKPTKP